MSIGLDTIILTITVIIISILFVACLCVIGMVVVSAIGNTTDDKDIVQQPDSSQKPIPLTTTNVIEKPDSSQKPIPLTTTNVIEKPEEFDYVSQNIKEYNIPDFAKLKRPNILMKIVPNGFFFELEPMTYLPFGLYLSAGNLYCDANAEKYDSGFDMPPDKISYTYHADQNTYAHIPNNGNIIDIKIGILDSKKVNLEYKFKEGTFLPKGLKISIRKLGCKNGTLLYE